MLLVAVTALCLQSAFLPQTNVAALRPLYEQALARRRAEFGPGDLRTAQAARDLGLFLAGLKEASAARTALQEAIRIEEHLLGAADRQTLADLAELAAVSNPAESLPLWKRVALSGDAELAIRARMALGPIYLSTGNRAAATAAYREALSLLETASGLDSAGAPAILSALAGILEAPEAIPLLLRALAAGRTAQGPRHPANAALENSLAERLLEVGRAEEALRAATDAVAIQQEALGQQHPLVARAMLTLARALETQREFPRAERLYLLAIEIDATAYGQHNAVTLADARLLAKFLRAQGRAGDAAQVEKRFGFTAPGK